jgi:iron complex outermembrane recepter protein
MTFRLGGPQAISPARRGHFGIMGALAASLALSTGIPQYAVAQEGGAIELEGIVVTGEKIDRDYLDTFTSVGIATNEDIRNYQLDELSDTFNQMANVRLFSSDRGNSGFQIRGVNADGVAAATNSQPLISVIIDGATQSVEGLKRGTRGTWDVKQVEVLRGPQSGLYGRSALAGAVVVETNDPSFTPEAEIKGVLGDQERRDGAFMVSGPIVDNQVAFRLSGEIREQEKDITFLNPADAELGEDIYHNIRGKLLIQPEAISGLTALFTVSHTFDKPSANAVTGPDFFAREFDGSGFTEFREANVDNYVSNISYGLAEGYTLRSVTALVDTDLKIDSAPSSTSFFRDDIRDGEDFTQDLRLEITEGAKTGLSGVVGVSYGDFKQDTQTNLGQDVGFGFPVPIQVGTIGSETETQAIYADLRYKIYGNWSVIGGLRYQHDVVRNFGDLTLFEGLAPAGIPTINANYAGEATFDVLLPKYGLAYEIDETQTVAATASRGYRQGFSELDLNVFAGTFDFKTVDPEYVWSYELAYRKTTLDKRLTLGVNLFYNDYTNQQVSFADADSLIYDTTANVGESISYGAEIEGRYDFGNGLTMFGAVGLLKTEFKDFVSEACAPSGGTCDGNEFPEAPHLTFSFGGTYKHASGFFGSASASYTGDYYTKNDVNNQSQFKIENFFLVNAKVGYEYQNMTLSLFADNLLDEQYITGLSTRNDPPIEASIGDGRVVGVELRAKF